MLVSLIFPEGLRMAPCWIQDLFKFLKPGKGVGFVTREMSRRWVETLENEYISLIITKSGLRYLVEDVCQLDNKRCFYFFSKKFK